MPVTGLTLITDFKISLDARLARGSSNSGGKIETVLNFDFEHIEALDQARVFKTTVVLSNDSNPPTTTPEVQTISISTLDINWIKYIVLRSDFGFYYTLGAQTIDQTSRMVNSGGSLPIANYGSKLVLLEYQQPPDLHNSGALDPESPEDPHSVPAELELALTHPDRPESPADIVVEVIVIGF